MKNQVQILQVRVVGKGFRVAHVKAGDLFGDVPCVDGLEPGAMACLKTSLVVVGGRLQASLKAERV